MKEIIIPATLVFFVILALLGIVITEAGSTTYQDTIIWDPNANLGTFTDLPTAFDSLIAKLDDVATVTVTGGGANLKTAIEGASSGDVIEIQDSLTYSAGTGISLSGKSNIVIRAQIGQTPQIDCSGLGDPAPGSCIKLSNANNIAFKGLTFKNVKRTNLGADQTITGAINAVAGGNVNTILIEDCNFINDAIGGDIAIQLTSVDNVAIRRVYMDKMGEHDYNTPRNYGAITIYASSNVYVQNCWASFSGAQQARGFVFTADAIVEYCLAEGAGTAGGGSNEGFKVLKSQPLGVVPPWDSVVTIRNSIAASMNRGIRIKTGTVTLENNIVDGSNDRGLRLDGGTITVSKNIVVNGAGRGVYVSGATVTLACNDVWNNNPDYSGISPGATDFSVNPNFVNPGIFDYTTDPALTCPSTGEPVGVILAPAAPPFIKACIDINPDTLNLKSNSKWITAYIELPEGYDAKDIVATTVFLNINGESVPAVIDEKYGFVKSEESYLTDQACEEGVLERMVKFEASEVKGLLAPDEVELTITGELIDGVPFEGSDTIRVIDKGNPPNAGSKGSGKGK